MKFYSHQSLRGESIGWQVAEMNHRDSNPPAAGWVRDSEPEGAVVRCPLPVVVARLTRPRFQWIIVCEP